MPTENQIHQDACDAQGGSTTDAKLSWHAPALHAVPLSETASGVGTGPEVAFSS